MAPKDTDHIITFIRDEFHNLHDHLSRQDAVFAQHVIEDKITAKLAENLQQRLEGIKKSIYVAWSILTVLAGLVIAYLKL